MFYLGLRRQVVTRSRGRRCLTVSLKKMYRPYIESLEREEEKSSGSSVYLVERMQMPWPMLTMVLLEMYSLVPAAVQNLTLP